MDEEEVFNEVLDLLEAEPTAGESNPVESLTRIPALREQLAVLVSTGKSKEAIGVEFTHEQLKRVTDKDVEKYSKRYETYVGSKTTDSLIDSFIFLVSNAIGMTVKIKDVDAYQKS